MVFQSYALFPHMTVRENVAYGPSTVGMASREASARVEEMLRLVDMADYRDRSVQQLSGGQQQRVALARALALEPDVLLLDEPLAALDLQLRQRLRDELRAIQERVKSTFVFVTHDQEEALSLSDRICVMQEGRVTQIGSPREIYERPQNRFVADFIGEADLLPCEVTARDATTATVRVGGGGQVVLPCFTDQPLQVGATATVVVRPEHVELAEGAGALFSGTVRRAMFFGRDVRHDIELASGERIRMLTPAHRAIEVGTQVDVTVANGACVV
jgi:ABC-type Fe3+/spermidine/putrescine transport system ATPase subunit